MWEVLVTNTLAMQAVILMKLSLYVASLQLWMSDAQGEGEDEGKETEQEPAAENWTELDRRTTGEK